MVQEFDQLWYTWALRGREGSNRLQVRAVSDGLADLTSRRARTALRFCRYPAGAHGLGDVSFGWSDVGSERVVFRRVVVPGDTKRRTGVAAHILMGDAKELPIAAAIRLWWWDGWRDVDDSQSSLDLQRIDPSALAFASQSAPLPHPQEIEEFIAAVMDARSVGRKIVLRGEPAESVVAVAGLLEALPHHLRLNWSYSTLEEPGTASRFTLATMLEAPSHPATIIDLRSLSTRRSPSATSRRAAAHLVRAADRPDAVIRAAALAAADADSSIDVFLAVRDVLASLGEPAEMSPDDLAGVLRIAPAADIVLDAPRGQAALAAGLVSGNRSVVEGLARLRHSSEHITALASEVASLASPSAALLSDLDQVDTGLRDSYLIAYGNGLQPADAGLLALDPKSRLALLRSVRCAQGRSATAKALAEVSPAEACALSAESDTSTDLAAALLARHLHAPDVLDLAIRLQQRDARFALRLLEEGAPGDCVKDVIRSPVVAKAADRIACDAAWTAASASDRAVVVATALDLRDDWQRVQLALQLSASPQSSAVLALPVVARPVEEAFRASIDGYSVRQLTLQAGEFAGLLRLLGGEGRSRPWTMLLEGVLDLIRLQPESSWSQNVLASCSALVSIVDGVHGQIGAAALLAAALPRAPTEEALQSTISEVRNTLRFDGLDMAAFVLRAVAEADSLPPLPATWIAYFVAQTFAPRLSSWKPSRRATRREVLALSGWLLALLPPDLRAEVGIRAEAGGKHSLEWYNDANRPLREGRFLPPGG